MAFNFPGGAVVGQEYVTGAGVTYVWNGYGWVIKAPDAPVDGKIYGRKDAAWAEIISDVTKAYVDAEVAKQVAATGDTMTGALVITGASLTAVGVTAGHRGFTPSNVDLASFVASTGSYGGGITLIDGANRVSMWAESANLILATGGNPPTRRLSLQNDGTHLLAGSLNATGRVQVSHGGGIYFRMRTPTHSVMLYADSGSTYYLFTNSGDPDGSYNALRPFTISLGSGDVNIGYTLSVGGHVYSAAGRLWGANDGAFSNYLPLGGGNMSGLLSTYNSVGNISYGGCAGGIQVLSNHPTDTSITFHRQGSFAMNFGMGGDGNLWFGGWSHGAVAWQLWSKRDFNYTPVNRGGDTITGGLTVNSTLVCDANIWAKGTLLYLGSGGHYIAWQDGWFYDMPHGPIRLQGAWVVRQGENVGLADIRASASIHSDGNHYYMAGDGVWYRWRGDIGRTEPSHGLYISTVHQTQGSYAEGYYQKGGVSGGFEGARFNIQNGGPAFNFWSENSNYGAIYMGSDYRIKKEVKPLPSMWEKVKALRPVSFKLNGQGGFRADGKERWGFIAHELQDALIASVANGKKDCENEVQAPWPMAVLAPITKALQEVMERVEILEGKLNG